MTEIWRVFENTPHRGPSLSGRSSRLQISRALAQIHMCRRGSFKSCLPITARPFCCPTTTHWCLWGPASLTQRKLATWYMAETAPTHQNTKQPHAADRCVHSPTGITDTRHTLAVDRNNDGRAQGMRSGVRLRYELCASCNGKAPVNRTMK